MLGSDPGPLEEQPVLFTAEPFLSPCTKLNSKWIKDLHIKPDTLKIIKKKLGKTLEDMGRGENFLNRRQIAFATNGAGSTGGQHTEDCELIHSYLLVLSSSTSGSRTST